MKKAAAKFAAAFCYLVLDLGECCIKRNRQTAAQNVGNRADFLGFFGELLELGFVDAFDCALSFEVHFGDFETFERDGRRGFDLFGNVTFFAQVVRKRHAKTRRVSCRDEFFGVGAGCVTKTRRKAKRGLVEDVRGRVDGATAAF